MTRLVVCASEVQYWDHLEPVARALRPDVLVTAGSTEVFRRAQAAGFDVRIGYPRHDEGPPVLVAGYLDAAHVHPARPLALMDHGAGQTYTTLSERHHAGQAGGTGWGRCELFLAPGPHAAEAWRHAYPDARVVELGGSPRLDHYAGRYPARAERPTVGMTWHWDMRVVMEARETWSYWHPAIARLRDADEWDLLGTAHPRIWPQLRPQYERLGIEHTPDFETILERASVLLCDNSSAAYEFAALDRPVLSLNAPFYRRDIEHGLRFWQYVPGLQCDTHDELAGKVEDAYCDAHESLRRRRAVQRAYGRLNDGCATGRAIEAIEDWLNTRGT